MDCVGNTRVDRMNRLKSEFCSQHRPSNLIGLIFRRGNDSSGRTLIGKLKNEPTNVISYELSRFILDSVEILS